MLGVSLNGVKIYRKEAKKLGKEAKTNAMRILERQKISYEMITYECENFVDGVHSAKIAGVLPEQSFKTLVMQGKSREFYVFVIPVDREVDMKKAARAVGEKSVEMIPVKDITKVTGYVRGGCSPIGMKKRFPTVIHESAKAFDRICVSGGRIGLSLMLSPADLAGVIGAEFGNIIFIE